MPSAPHRPGEGDGRPRLVLVTGATGYIGGRLVPCLLDAGYRVRCFARDPDRLADQPWADRVEMAQGDVLRPETLPAALAGVDAAYYLIHSLAAGADYAARDRRAADHFGAAAERAGVGRIIYLGGIEPKNTYRSEHLSSRLETGERLRAHGVPVTEFRAAVVVGSGSLSFELIRYLTERLPVLICPRWVQTPTQPIAVRSVLQYLIEALERPETAGEVYEIGGRDVLSYGDMFRIYAEVRGLKRIIVNVPVLTPRTSSLWVGLVTPVPTPVARPLIEGLDNEVVVQDERAREVFDVAPIPYEMAVRLALRRFTQGEVTTSWHDAYSSSMPHGRVVSKLEDEEGMIQEVRTLKVRASAEDAFRTVSALGGEEGWLYLDALWEIRGFFDLLVGGVGTRRGRRDPTALRTGDALDFWRVEAVRPNRLLRLRAEMKVPGKAWLQFEIAPVDDDPECVLITQTALFEPKGLFGFLYWYLFYIPHLFIFPGMLRRLGARAEEHARTRALRPESTGPSVAA